MQPKKILITGAGGFIGSHLVEELFKEELEITALIHYNSRNSNGLLEQIDKKILKNIRIIHGDIEDLILTRSQVKGHDIVIHLAALIGIPYSYHAMGSYISTNIQGTYNLLEASRETGVKRFIHTSTSEVYGTAQYLPIDEDHPVKGQSPYSASKIAADKLVESYYYSFNFPTVILRPFNNFGPRQSLRAVIPAVIAQALKRSEIKIGSTEPKRDFVYVKDCVKAYLAAIAKKGIEGATINIGTGSAVSIAQAVEIIGKILGGKIKLKSQKKRIRPQHSEVYELVCNNKKAKKLLGWEPKVSFEEGLTETISWMKSNINFYKTAIYNI